MRIDHFIPNEVTDLLGVALLLVAQDGSLLDASPAALECYRCELEELVSRNLADLESAPAQEGTGAMLLDLAASGEPYRAEHTTKSGSKVSVEAKVTQVSFDGESAFLMSIQPALGRSGSDPECSERLKAVVDNTSEGIFVLSREGEIVWLNETMARMHGYTVEEMLAMDLADLDTRESAKHIPERMVRVFAGESISFETEHYRKGGEVIPLEVTTSLVLLGGKKYAIAFHRDITKRVSATTALKDREQWLNESQRIARLGHYVFDLEADRWAGSPALYDVLGATPEDAGDFDSLMRVVHAEDREWVREYVTTEMLGKRKPFDIECRIVRLNDGEVRWVHASGKVERHADGRPSAMFGIIQDITERHELEAALAGRVEERAVLLRRLSDMVTSIIDVVDNVSEMRDPYTAGHQRRVAEIAVSIAEELRMGESDVDDIRVAGMMHDIGKMSVPAEILSKPSELSATELALIQGHAEAGYNIIAAAQMQGPIAELIYEHHERCDGSGYPRGLTADQLLPGAKVLMVADVVESMMSHRPYRAALGPDMALAEIERGAGTVFDREVVDACMRVFRNRGFSVFGS